MKKIIFKYDSANCHIESGCIDLRDEDLFKRFSAYNESSRDPISFVLNDLGDKWKVEFLQWLGALNSCGHDVYWWAHTSTAKNLLSSPLGDEFFQVKVACEFIRKCDKEVIHIIGATPAQMDSIISICSDLNVEYSGNYYKSKWMQVFGSIKILFRLFFQLAFVFFGFWGSKSLNAKSIVDVSIFTYLDSEHNPKEDKYFGRLPEIISKGGEQYSIAYFAYLYAPYRKRIREILKTNSAVTYIPLFSFLHVSDYAWAIVYSVRELFICALSRKKEFHVNKKYKSLLQEAFLYDISHGGYLHNLLVYRSIQRSSVKCKVKKIIYPFENKSLEKMILMGILKLDNPPKTVGYQHTSITPRHLTFLFEAGEAENTPLPDKIVTVGEITNKFLTDNGDYPKGLIKTSCALRQSWSKPYLRNTEKKKTINILLALSSSKFELVQSVKYFQELVQLNNNIKLGIRPHINFSMTLLPRSLSIWVKKYAIDFSGTSLDENLKWCDITAYVSSTVALESLMRGKPVINISIGDYISPDPIIGTPDFCFSARNPKEFLSCIEDILYLPNSEYQRRRKKSIEYVEQYLSPISSKAIQEFL